MRAISKTRDARLCYAINVTRFLTDPLERAHASPFLKHCIFDIRDT
jgi:hypothetical protein